MPSTTAMSSRTCTNQQTTRNNLQALDNNNNNSNNNANEYAHHCYFFACVYACAPSWKMCVCMLVCMHMCDAAFATMLRLTPKTHAPNSQPIISAASRDHPSAPWSTPQLVLTTAIHAQRISAASHDRPSAPWSTPQLVLTTAIHAQQRSSTPQPAKWKDPRLITMAPQHLAKEYSPATMSSSSIDHGILHNDHDNHHAKEYSPAMTRSS